MDISILYILYNKYVAVKMLKFILFSTEIKRRILTKKKLLILSTIFSFHSDS